MTSTRRNGFRSDTFGAIGIIAAFVFGAALTAPAFAQQENGKPVPSPSNGSSPVSSGTGIPVPGTNTTPGAIKILEVIAPKTISITTTNSGTVVLSGIAPTGGVIVNLTSTNPNAVTVDPKVTVEAGKATATFPLRTPAQATGTATIRAESGGSSAEISIQISDDTRKTDTIDSTRMLTGVCGLLFFVLALAAQFGVMMVRRISWDNFSYRLYGMSILIGAGVYLVIIGYGAAEHLITPMMGLLGTALGYLLGKDSPGSAGLPIPPSTLAAITVMSGRPGSTAIGSVTLSGAAPPGGAEISLMSRDENVVKVPAKVVVPAGSSSATFNATVASSAGTEATAVIEANFDGHQRDTTFAVIK